jgi:23S rRNA (adenine2503-C2)-methyltransferase
MKVVASSGREDVAVVYILESDSGKLVECVESVQPPIPREQKWVLLVSTLFGCPIGCKMCDAGGAYHGKLTKEEIFAQIDFLVRKRFPDGNIPCRQFKIQLARMGEPAWNAAVLDVLDELPGRYHAPGLMPSLSTVAPAGTRRFFERLLEIKAKHYSGGHFQLQFSIHTTDLILRDQIIPAKKWSFAEVAEYGERFFAPGDRKVTLNFALAHGMPVEPDVLLRHFSSDRFLIKITPLNPTYRALENRLSSYIDPVQAQQGYELVDSLRAAGYEVIVSIGEAEENRIGSNCGQYLRAHLEASEPIKEGYTYRVQEHAAG